MPGNRVYTNINTCESAEILQPSRNALYILVTRVGQGEYIVELEPLCIHSHLENPTLLITTPNTVFDCFCTVTVQYVKL